jgi:hypothetical protein
MKDYYFERTLFVVGAPNSGKSTQLRSIFRDVRFGTGGNIPTDRKLPDFYRLSNDRCLYLRLSSPHELKESLGKKQGGRGSVTNFLKKTEEKIASGTPELGRRWNLACPLQPHAANNMPDVVETCKAFVKYFKPESARVVFLSPDRHGVYLQETLHGCLSDDLRRIPSVEVCWIDARDRSGNGLLLADFFDFI